MEFDIDKMYCGSIKRGDIFLSNLEKNKYFVVLQDQVLNERLATVIVAPLEKHASDKVFKNEVLFLKKELGFDKEMICMLHKMQLLDRRQLVAKMGEVKKDKLVDLYKALDVTLGRFRDKRV